MLNRTAQILIQKNQKLPVKWIVWPSLSLSRFCLGWGMFYACPARIFCSKSVCQDRIIPPSIWPDAPSYLFYKICLATTFSCKMSLISSRFLKSEEWSFLGQNSQMKVPLRYTWWTHRIHRVSFLCWMFQGNLASDARFQLLKSFNPRPPSSFGRKRSFYVTKGFFDPQRNFDKG